VDSFIPFFPLVVTENGTDAVNGMLKIAAAAMSETWKEIWEW
jgi:hypothetical protein